MIQKLIKVQAALKAPKSQFNAFGKYKYRSCEDILEAVKPLLVEQGLMLTLTDIPQEVGGRIYIAATAAVTDGTNMVSVTAYAREEDEKKGMDASQITGTASSYARKYALNGLFLIDDCKDADATNDHGKKQAAKPKQAPKQPDALKAAKAHANKAMKAFCERNGTDYQTELVEFKENLRGHEEDAGWFERQVTYYEAN